MTTRERSKTRQVYWPYIDARTLTMSQASIVKPPGTSNEQSGKQEGMYNADTRHSSDIQNNPDKSTKAEGGPDTAKAKGTVRTDRELVSSQICRPVHTDPSSLSKQTSGRRPRLGDWCRTAAYERAASCLVVDSRLVQHLDTFWPVALRLAQNKLGSDCGRNSRC